MNVPVWDKQKWKIQNSKNTHPFINENGQPLIIGCNYHTKWQSHPSMRFVLTDIDGEKAKLQTRQSKKTFWTSINDLIFINTCYNQKKAKELTNQQP